MQCPKCKSTPLKRGKITAKQLVLDQCSTCKGLWFDKGELTRSLGAKAKKYFVTPNFSVKVPDSKCPRCDDSLYEFCYPGTLTLVDGCKQCEGVWLDSNEWKAISHARDESNKINCPKCHTRQSPAESCVACGIIIAKYQTERIDKNLNTVSKKTIVNDNHSIKERSYADNIPGLKGMLLRMIDRTIKNLSSGARQ
jgi:Zn-finger nucleic acid-binding protein